MRRLKSGIKELFYKREIMINRISSYFAKMRIGVVLVLCLSSLNLMAQTENINFAGSPPYELTSSNSLKVPITLTAGFGYKGTIQLIIPTADGYVFTGGPIVDSNDKMTINNSYVTGGNTLNIEFEFVGELASIAEVFVEFVKAPGATNCGDITSLMTLKLIEDGSTDEIVVTANIILKEYNITLTATQISFSVLNCIEPLEHTFRLSSSIGASGQQVFVDYEFDPLLFEVLSIQKYSNGVAYNIGITYVEPGKISFTDDGANTYTVFLKQLQCNELVGLHDIFKINAEYYVSWLTTCEVLASLDVPYDNDLLCCDDYGNYPGPYMLNYSNSVCVDLCELEYKVAIGNIGTNVDFTDLIYTVIFPDNITIIDVTESSNTAINSSSTISTSSSGFQQLINLNDGQVHTLTVKYVFNGAPLFRTSMLIDQSLSSVLNGGGVLPDNDYTITFRESSCTPRVYLTDYADTSNIYGATQIGGNSIYTLEGEDPRNIQAYIRVYKSNSYPSAVSNFSFEYELNSHLLLADNTDIQFFYGTPVSYSQLRNITFEPIGNVPEILSFEEVGDNMIRFTGINLPKECPGGKDLFIKFRVRSQFLLDNSVQPNIVTKTSGPTHSTRLIRWDHFEPNLVQAYTQASCNTSSFDDGGSVDVDSEFPFYYHYVLSTTSGQINEPIMVGSLPHVSDLNLLSGTNRGSAFDVSCANELEVKIVRDFRGTVTTQNLSSSDYDIVFANSFAGLCTDINTLAVSSGGSCSSATACTGQPLFFRIKLKTGVPVSSYSRLVVSLKSNALGSIIGTEGNASFVFGYNEAAGQVQETGVATIIIAEISDCKTEPPCAECENSFAPSIDSAYVLSAWVKEGDTYGVATYDNVNITLFFEGLTPEVDVTLGPFYPSGDIIDGWQRVEQVFTVPSTALKIKIILNN
ncbi:MAG: hypothetical protein HRT71_02615, partial [Flavobacteriales bacterium]|nr:hypothetical protein [Flavobacteriales bacterium]